MNHWPTLSAPLEGDVLRTLSLGIGVQSSTLALMAARGDIGPMPDAAIFADTGGESARSYEYLKWLREQLPFPIFTVRRAGPALAEHSIAVANGSSSIKGSARPPFYTMTRSGARGMLPKQCSGTYKRDVVLTEIRRLLGYGPGQRIIRKAPIAEVWIGISKDEMQRVATSRQRYIHNRHPLIEMNMTRRDCLRWLRERQFRVPVKSSCIFCPYRTNAQWRDMRDNAPDDFESACRTDDAIRPGSADHDGEAFVHRQCVPLREADLQDDNLDQQSFGFAIDCDRCGA